MNKTPEVWSAEKGIRIMDPDGWRGIADPSWDEPIPLDEFEFRAAMSTCQIVDRDKCDLWGLK